MHSLRHDVNDPAVDSLGVLQPRRAMRDRADHMEVERDSFVMQPPPAKPNSSSNKLIALAWARRCFGPRPRPRFRGLVAPTNRLYTTAWLRALWRPPQTPDSLAPPLSDPDRSLLYSLILGVSFSRPWSFLSA